MPAWEIGRAGSGLGVKIGGLGAILEELPGELVKSAQGQGIDLEVDVLSPCFAHFDRGRLTDTGLWAPSGLDGHDFSYKVYEHNFPDGQRVVYFWDEWQLSWTGPTAIYPEDPVMAFRTFAATARAMAAYIRHANYDAVHCHDYHVGLIPFYLGDDFLSGKQIHFTVHNATYQGLCPPGGSAYQRLFDIGLDGYRLFHEYFDFFGYLNPMKAAMIKTHQQGGKITTVSGDIGATWGYAAELRENMESLMNRARSQKWWGPVGEVFLPNRHLDVFERLPVAGITNGLADRNRPEKMPELRAEPLRAIQQRRPDTPIFRHPVVQREMLEKDHAFDVDHLAVKAELKRLLHLESFNSEPQHDPILITVVGRLVSQKNLGLVADVAGRVFDYDAGVKFVIMASAGDGDGVAAQNAFFQLSRSRPERFSFRNDFNQPVSRLILAGGDFCLVPSRFEPCGLVDFEASLMGNVVIGRRTGGLAKVGHCAYLYEWLDVSDRGGEADAFFGRIREAIDVYRWDRGRHDYLMRTAMAVDASWDRSAAQYVRMYRYGRQFKRWQQKRSKWIQRFIESLDDEMGLFSEFLRPGEGPFGDGFNRQLRQALWEAESG